MSKINYRVYPFVLAAGEMVLHRFNGSHVRFLDATAELSVAFDNGSFEPLPVALGVEAEEEFEAVRVLNETANPVAYRLALSRKYVTDNRLEVEGSIAIRGGGSRCDWSSIDVSNVAVLLLAANANRTSGFIKAGTAALWVDDIAGVAAGTLATLEAGETLNIAHTGAVYGIRGAIGALPAGAYEESSS